MRNYGGHYIHRPLIAGLSDQSPQRPYIPQTIALTGFESVKSVGRYEGELKDLVLELKRGAKQLAKPLAESLFPLVDSSAPPNLVTWIPSSKKGLRARGFDQSELLAKHLAKKLDVACIRTVRRTDKTSQHSLGKQSRQLGPSFRLLRPIRGRILLVDDVITTGATLKRYHELVELQNQCQLDAICLASAN